MTDFDKLQDIIGIVRNSFLNDNWRGFSKFQFKEMFEVLYQLADKESISEEAYNKAIVDLEDLGLEVSPMPLAYQKTNIGCKGAT